MALEVEDGTGKTNADSYLSVDDADAYWDNHGQLSAWMDSTTAQKEEALRVGTQYLDMNYGPAWKGSRTNGTQALDFPRSDMVDRDEYNIDSDSIPTKLEHATAEAAYRHRNETDGLFPDVSASDSGVKRERVRVGEIEDEKEYSGAKVTTKQFLKIDALVRDFVHGGLILERA